MDIKKIKIAIVELASHHEVMRSYGMLALQSKCDVSFFTTIENQAQCNALFENTVDWQILPKDQTSNEFLSIMKFNLELHDIILFTSLEDVNGFLLKSDFTKPTVGVLHDATSIFHHLSNIKIKPSIKHNLKIVKYLSLGFYQQRVRASKQYDLLLLPTECSYKDLKNNKNVNTDKLFALPFLYNENIKKTTSDSFDIVIPGTISQDSRDYRSIIKMIEKLNLAAIDNINLILLGKPKGKDGNSILIDYIKATGNKIKLTYFYQEVSQQIYDSHLMHADVLLLPLMKNPIYGVVDSISGWRLSGNIGDLVRFGKTALLPYDYKIDEDLAPMATTYQNNDDLFVKINQLISNKKQGFNEDNAGIYKQYNELQIKKFKSFIVHTLNLKIN